MRRFILGLAFCTTSSFVWADNVPQVTIYQPINNQTVSGTVPVYARASDDTGVVKVQFFYDYYNLFATITNATPIPQEKVYTAKLNTSGLTPGLHEIEVHAYSQANEGFNSIMVNVSSGPTSGCQDLRVSILNLTNQVVGGAVSNNTAQPPTGAGFSVNPADSVIRDIPVSPQAGAYSVQGLISQFGSQITNLSCLTAVPVVNDCPKVGTDAVLTISDKSVLQCSMSAR